MEQQGSLNAEIIAPQCAQGHPQNRPPAPRIYLWRLAPVFLLALGVFLLSFFCLLGFPSMSLAAANYRYVALTGNDSSPDCSVSAPCRTIWRAINVLPVDEIRVAAGRYTEIITINNSISLRGGFTTTNWTALPDPVKNVTIIDAQDLGRVIYHTSISTTVSGFHLTGGRASVGAGVYNLGTLTLENNKIYNNNETGSSDGGGGVTNGAFGMAATLILKHNQIYSNTASNGSDFGLGGGVSVVYGSALLEANEIFSNSAFIGGGGCVLNGDVTLKNNLFYNNVSTDVSLAGGGGFAVNNGTVDFENNTFSQNRATQAGGGLYIYAGTVTLINNLIISNTSSITNGGIHRETATLNLSFTDFFGNLPNNGFTTGSNNRANQDYSNFNFYLTDGSPAIDSGAITTTVTTDIEGEGRPFGGGIDRGADEYTTPGGVCFARPVGGQVYTDVQPAVSSVPSGGIVQVAGWCKLAQTLNITHNLTLRGGYTVTDWLNPAYGPTVLDGQGQRQVIYITHTTGVTLENLHIVSGVATTNGAGLYINNSVNTTLRNNVIAFNRASSSNGGGIYVDNSNNTVLQHNTMYSNTANQGGGVYANVASVTLRNSLVVSNSGGGLYQGSGGSFSLGYNDFFGNTGSSNVTFDPTDIFVWPGLANPAALNFHLLYASSQVIGQADPNSPLNTDFENDTRPQGARVDIGADESLFYAEIDISDAPYFRITDIDAVKGKTITFTHTITNMGHMAALTDSFDIEVVNSDAPLWGVRLIGLGPSVVLTTGVPLNFQVVVTVPLTPPVSIFNRTTITATSRTNPAIFDHTVDLIANPGVILEPSYRQKVNPGTVITYTHILTNTGFSTDTFSLTYIPGPFNWTQIVTPQVVTVGPGGSAFIWAVVAVTDTAAVQLEDVLTLTAQSHTFVDVSDTVTDATIADAIVSPRFVKVGGRDKDNNCAKSTDPCGSINWAYGQATAGDNILVAQGEYADRLFINGKRVNLLGSWDTSTITRLTFIDPSKTIINAQNTDRVLLINGSSTFQPVVDGFTLKNGRTSGVGGAVYIQAGMPILTNLIIQDSSTTRDGGGVYIEAGKASLNVITITNTSAGGNGGGIYVKSGQPIIQKSRIYQTQAVTGGGVYIAGGAVNLWNNLIYNNTAAFGGGGVYNRDTVYLINDTLYNNHAGTSGGGVYYDAGSNQLVISNTIIVSNTAVISGGGVYRNGSNLTQVYYNDVWGNTPNNYSNVTPDSNNIAANPRFVDAAAFDLHLQLGSPAVDTASPNTFLTDDFEGDLRPNDQGYDIGADELSGCRARIVDATRAYSPTAWYGSGPYAVLQTAINHAPNDHIIQIAGVCRGVNQRLIGGQAVSQTAILSDSGKALTLEGGYMADFSTRDPGLYPTFIDPQGRGRALLITGTKPITLIDLNLVNGQAQGLSNGGGGLYNYNSTLLLAGVIISNSQAALGGGLYNVAGTLAFTQSDTYFVPTQLISNTASSGGGMYLAGGRAVLTYTQIATNTAGTGGGVYNNGGLFDGLFLTVANNAASGEGGGIYHNAGQFIIQRSFILSNTASANGGGLRNSAALTMVNTMIAGNRAANGGGLYNQSVNLVARHDTFYANAATGAGGGMYHSANGGVVNSSIFADNTAPTGAGVNRQTGSLSFQYNDLFSNSSSFTPDGTNITGDPLFISTDPASPLYLRLQTGSPAEDTADPASPVRNDIDDDPRPSNQGFDMGADEIATCYVRNFTTTIVYGSIQVAVDESSPHDFLQVAGMCQGVNTRDPGAGPVAQTVMITKSLDIRGGYNHLNWDAPPQPTVYTSTLDALYRGRVVYVTGSPVVSISGLIIRQGSGVNGGGIFIATGVVSLSENVVYSNTATNGGGIYNQSGSVYMFKDNQVYSNTANLGGGMYNAGGLAVLDDNDWQGNRAGRGGAFYHNGGSVTLQNNIIRANNNVITGGGVYNNAAGLVVRHNTFYGNNLGLNVGDGGGFYTAVPNTTLVNNIFFNNAAANGRAIYGPAGFNPTYNDVYNDNTVTYPNTLLYGGGAAAGTGGLSIDPRLVDPVNGDFHLQDTSPVLDRGDPAMTPIFDFEGDLRPGDQGFDMGADERASCLAKNVTISPTVIYGNLQRAIDNSSAGDTIRVALGECRGVHRYGSISQTIHIDHKLTLLGQYDRPNFLDPFRGYDGGFTSQTRDGMPPLVGSDVSTETSTILNPTGLGRALLITNSAVVTMEGFTLISGTAVGLGGGPSSGDAGGGVYVNAGSWGNLAFIRVYQSRAAYGGAIYNAAGSTLTLYANLAIGNSTTVNGGGIFNSGVLTLTTDGNSVDGPPANLFATAISNNTAGQRGGGIYNQSGGDLRLINHEIGVPLDDDEIKPKEIFDQISGNRTTTQDGGGIYNESGAILKSERFEIGGNHTDGAGSNGGGLYNAGTANLDPGNKFHSNYTQQNGGAIYNTSVLTLWNTVLYYNTAINSSGNGGGLYEASSNPNHILHNTFSNNQTQNGGGAVYILSGSNRTIKNNIFDGDSSTTNNGHAIRVGSGSVTVDYNDYWDMSLTNAVSGTGIVTGAHSLAVDPLFVVPGADFHVGRDENEPPGKNTDVVDAGEILTNVLHDFERDPRPINTSSDMGADEYKACLAQAWVGDSEPRGPIRGRIMDALADAKLNGATTIHLAGQACVELVTIDQDIILQGSWERPEPGPDEDKINVRITDPYVTSPRIQAPYDQDGPVVDILPGGANSVRLEWLKLTNGHNPGGNGGGLRTIATNVTLDNIEVLSNSAQSGGGVYVGGGDVTISEVSFYSNRAQDCGGGFYAGAGHTYLTGISFGYYLPFFPEYNENKAARGGGLCFEGPADIGVHNAWIQYNDATAGSGGGIYAANSGALQVINTGFYSNTATADGGGLYRSSGGSNPALYHTTFRENIAQGQGGGVYNSGTPLLIKASIVASNRASTYNGVAGLANIDYTLRWANDYAVPGTNVTNEIPSGDPRFLDDYWYDLHYTSAAINKVPNAETTFNHDMVNEPRPMMCLKDGGADEYYVERSLQWLSPLAPANIGEVAPTQSFTHTFSLRNASIHWTRLNYSPPIYEDPGEGTGYPESLTVTVQSTKPGWTHEIVGITGASNPVINGLTTTFTISPGAVVSISVKVTVPTGTFASIATDSTTIDFTSLHYDSRYWDCAEVIDSGAPLIAETRAKLDRSFVIVPDYITTTLYKPGDVIPYIHTVINTGNITDSYHLEGGSSRYGSGNPYPQEFFNVAPGMSRTVVFSVTLNQAAAGGLTDRTYLSGVSLDDATVFASAYDETPIAYITGTRYVAANGNDEIFFDETDLVGYNISDNNCTQREQSPCRTLQHALNQAAPGDLIKLAGGTYNDVVTATYQGQLLNQMAFISKPVTLQGGFSPFAWDENPPNHTAHPTILNPQSAARVFYIAMTSPITIEWLNLSGGSASGLGGGPAGEEAGGNIYNAGAPLTLRSVQLNNGSANMGGGLYISGSTLLLQNSMLHNNQARRSGEAPPAKGGAIYIHDGAAWLQNDTFYNNISTQRGGGVYIYTGTLLVTNTVFATNTAPLGGDAIYNDTGSVAVDYNLYDNDDLSSVITGTHDLSGDPRFVDLGTPDLHVQRGSPALDKANPATTLTTDYDNDLRPLPGPGLFDIGADERVQLSGVSLTPPYTVTAVAGSAVVLTHTLRNDGEFTDTYTMTFTHNQTASWTVNFDQAVPFTVTLGSGDSRTITVTYTIPAGSAGQMWLTVITATSAYNPNSTGVVADRIDVAAADWAIGKEVVPPDIVQAGDRLTYTLTLTNVGELDSSGLFTVSDELPANTYFVSADPAPVLTSPVVQWVTNTQVASYTGVMTFTYVVTVSRPLTQGMEIVNQVYTVTGGGAPNPTLGQPVTVTVVAPASLTATKTASHNPVQAGAYLTYTITVSNSASAFGPAQNVVINDNLPVELVLQSAEVVSPATGSVLTVGNNVSWQLTSLIPAGGAAQVTVTARVVSPLAANTILTNTYDVTASNVLTPVSGFIATVVSSTNSITLHKTVDPISSPVNSLVNYLITLTNTGNGVATVMLTDTLSAGFVPATYFATVEAPGRTWDAPGVTIVSFNATTPPALGVYPNRAITATYDLTRVVLTDSAPVTVTAPPSGLILQKVASSPFVQVGDAVVFTVTAINSGAVTLTTVISDAQAPGCSGSLGALAPDYNPHSITCTVSNVRSTFINTATAVATPTLGSVITESAAAVVTVVTPTLQVVKLPASQMVQNGGTVMFTISVTNTGNITLPLVTVTDPQAPGCNNSRSDLGIGENWQYPCSWPGVSASFTNTAIVTGTPPAGRVTTGTALARVQVITPAIRLTKLPASQPVAYNAPVTFTIIVTNTGDVTLTNIAVSDPQAADCNRPGLGALAGGGVFTYTCSVLTATVDFMNIATVTATPPVGSLAPVTATAFVDVQAPNLAVSKLPASQLARYNGAVAFTVTVTNTGDVTLTTVAISDTMAAGCDASVTNLAPHTSTTTVCSMMNITANLTNTVVVTGTSAGVEVTGTARALVQVISPSLRIDKSTDGLPVIYGKSVTFTIAVTNSGDITLTNVTVTDPLVTACGRSLGTLPAGVAYPPYTCVLTPALSDFTNQATVTGTPPVGSDVIYTDTADVRVIGPELTITKFASAPEVLAGQVVTFTVTVTNTGDVTLTPVVISDALLPACNLNLSVGLAISATTSRVCTATVLANLTNSATVTGVNAGLEVTNTASATVIMVAPPTGVSINGPASGWINTAYPFTATVSPITTTLPLTYVWQAAGQTTVTNTNVNALNNAVSFNWNTSGVKVITVTASNRLGTVTDTHTILVSACYAQVTSSGFTYPTVQEAVDAAPTGDLVKVAGYCEGVNYRASLSQTVYLSKTLTLRGGYTPANWTVSDPVANPTTLDALSLGRVIYVTGNISPTIEGFRVTGGNSFGLGGGWPVGQDSGGGIYIINATATISNTRVFSNISSQAGGVYLLNSDSTLTGNLIYSNTASQDGGGLFLQQSNALLTNNTINNNTAYGGGGLFVDLSTATISSNVISGNITSGASGGGLFMGRGNSLVINNTIVGNRTNFSPFGGGGGGVLLLSDSSQIISNTISGNMAFDGGGLTLDFDCLATLRGNLISANIAITGGGLSIISNSNATLINNAIVDNLADTAVHIEGSSPRLWQTTIAHNNGVGVLVDEYNTTYSQVAMTNTILVSHTTGIIVLPGNTATVNGTLWYGNTANWGGAGTIISTNEITGAPAFAADGYHLTAGSAAVDRGVDSGVADDIDGEPRYFGLGYDLGADEYPGLLPPPTLIAPPNGTITNTHAITLEWSKVGALTYTLHLSGSVFNRPPGGGTTVISPTVLPDGVYTWTVEAYDYFGRTSGVTDTWVFTIDTSVPGVAIAKQPASQYALSGGAVNFTITVTNTGGNALNPVVISDTLAPACDRVTALNRGAVVSYTCTLNVSADITNTAVVTATPPVGEVVTATSAAVVVKIITPSIIITKTPDSQLIPSGGTANFTITMQNSGNITLTNVTVTDPQAPNCNRPSLGTLASGASTTYTCVLTNVTTALINTAFVTGTHPAGGVVTGFDTAQVNVIHPLIAIAKTPASQIGYSGVPVTFTIYVTNTGDVTLTNVLVADPGATNCNRDINALIGGDFNPGASASYSCSVTLISNTVDIINVANVSGDWAVGSAVTANNSAFVDYSPPAQSRLISPPNQTYTNNQNVTFVWSAATDAVSYTLNINGAAYLTTTTSYNFNPLGEGNYDWTVLSLDAYSRTLGYTATWRVTVDVTPPTSPTLLAPPNGVVISSTTRPPFDWSDSTDSLSGPVTYTVIITNSSGGVSRYNTGVTSAFTPTSNLPGGVYTWTVVAYDRAGNASPSPDVFTVTVEIPLTGVYLPIIFKNYTAPPPRPDLVVTNMTVTPNAGGGSLVQVTVRNQSSVAVTVGNNFHVYVYQNSNFSSPIIIWGVQGAWFGAGQSRVLTQAYTFSAGTYQLDAWADPSNVVAESDETNNTFALPSVVITGLSAEGGALPEPPLLPGPLPTPTLTP